MPRDSTSSYSSSTSGSSSSSDCENSLRADSSMQPRSSACSKNPVNLWSVISRTPCSDQPTVPCRIRPRIKPASGTIRPLGNPDLLERSPVVGCALPEQQVSAIGALKADVHLETPEVWRIRVGPHPLVTMDTKPGLQTRWMVRPVGGALRALQPQVPDPPAVRDAADVLGCLRRARQPHAHQLLPAPGLVPGAMDAREQEGSVRRRHLVRLVRPLGALPGCRRSRGEDGGVAGCERKDHGK